MRALTEAQHARLEGIAREDEDACVVGWHANRSEGPIVRFGDGRRRWISQLGRLGVLPGA